MRAIGWIQGRFGVAACHRYVVSFTRSAADIAAVYRLARLAVRSGPPPVLDVVPLFESGADLANATCVLDGMLELAPVAARLAGEGQGRRAASWRSCSGYSDSAKELGPVSATLALYDAQERLARLGGRARRPAHPVPRPRRGARAGRRPGRAGGAGPGARVGGRAAQGHRAGRGHLRQVRAPGHRAAPPGAGHLGGAARLGARGAGAGPGRGAAVPAGGRPDGRAGAARLPGPGRGRRVRRMAGPDQPAGGTRPDADRVPAAAPGHRRSARPCRPGRAAGDPVGVRVGADQAEPARLVRPGQRAGGGARRPRRAGRGAGRPTRAGRCSPCCWRTPR